MTRQVLSAQVIEQRPSVDAWVRLLRAHSALTRTLSADLVRGHGLTINDYEVLLHLARAPDHHLRRVDLARSVLLSPSGITRLLDGLEREGWVAKRSCDSDARVTYAVLTDEGFAKIAEASETHVGGIREVFESRFNDEELELLGRLLAKLPEADVAGESCSAD